MYADAMTRPCEGTLTFVGDTEEDFWAPPVYQISVPCNKCKDLGYTLDIITNDISYYGFTKTGRSLIDKCENIIQNHISCEQFLKEQNITDPYSINKRRWSFMDFKKLFEYLRQENLNNIKMNNKIAVGSWLLLSPVTGGWNFETLKIYLMGVFTNDCVNSESILKVLFLQNDFEGIFKIENREDLKAIILRFRNDKIKNTMTKYHNQASFMKTRINVISETRYRTRLKTS